MLVLMDHSGAIQLACKAISAPQVCGVCKNVIPLGGYYTKHQAPDPRYVDSRTGRTRMIPYNACAVCAPYKQLEQHTGEISLPEILRRARAESEETLVMPAVTRTSTPRPTSSIQRRISAVLKPVRLEHMREEERWLR